MVTTVTKTIGVTSRDYSTLQLWEDAISTTNLTTVKKHSANTFSGTFTTMETVNFTPSGASAKILYTDGSTYVLVGTITGTIATSDTCTGASSGATCTITSGTATDTGAIWKGNVYKDGSGTDGEFSVGNATACQLNGQTTSSTCYMELTAASGQSFADNANELTNALRYNRANGVAITGSGTYGTSVIKPVTQNTRISRLQIKGTGVSAGNGHCTVFGTYTEGGGNNLTADTLILEGASNGGMIRHDNAGVLYQNVILLADTASTNQFVWWKNNTTVYSCTFARTSENAAGGTGLRSIYGTVTMKNSAVFGFTTVTSGTFAGNNCATDQASFGWGTSHQTSVAFTTSTFQEPSNASSAADYRAVDSSALENNGADLSGSGVTVDIVGSTRSATPTIGCWEVAAGAGTTVGRLINSGLMYGLIGGRLVRQAA